VPPAFLGPASKSSKLLLAVLLLITVVVDGLLGGAEDVAGPDALRNSPFAKGAGGAPNPALPGGDNWKADDEAGVAAREGGPEDPGAPAREPAVIGLPPAPAALATLLGGPDDGGPPAALAILLGGPPLGGGAEAAAGAAVSAPPFLLTHFFSCSS